jgi:small-conductance mechanosensitive channel
MEKIIAGINHFFSVIVTVEKVSSFFWFCVVIGIVFIAFSLLSKIAMKVAKEKCNAQAQYIIGKAIHYTGIVIAVMTAFNRLGINFSALVGAAGIAGIAIGFAAQTSVSNVISGVFVMTERAFKIGDLLQVDSIIGTVEAIDLLSIRLKTAENQLVRIPNETIIKTNLINVTHFTHRRFTLRIGVAYGSDLRNVKEILLDTAAKNEYALLDPPPVVIFDSFGDSAIEVICGVWSDHDHFLDLKNSMMMEVSSRFALEHIEIPFPQVDVRMRNT